MMVALTSKHPVYLVGLVLMFGGFVIFLAAFGSHQWADFEDKQQVNASRRSGYFGLFQICYFKSDYACQSTANNEPFSGWAKVLQCVSVVAGIAFVICAVLINVTPLNFKNEKWILVPLMLASVGFGIVGAIVFGATFTTYITFSSLSWSFGVSLAGNGLELLAAILVIWSPVRSANTNDQTTPTGQTTTTSGKSETPSSCPTIQIGTTPARWSPENPSLCYIDTSGNRRSYCSNPEYECPLPTTKTQRKRPLVPNAPPLEAPHYLDMENRNFNPRQKQDKNYPVRPPSQVYVVNGEPSVKWTRHSEPGYANEDSEADFGYHGNGANGGENMADDAGFGYHNNSRSRDDDGSYLYYNDDGHRGIHHREDDGRFAYKNNGFCEERSQDEGAPPSYHDVVNDGRIVFTLDKSSSNNCV